MTKSLDRLIGDAAAPLSQYFDGGEHNTDLLRAAAKAIVGIRGRFHRKDGVTDWGGRTAEYRDAIREVYARAHLSPEQVAGLQNNKLSYHIRQALDARVAAEELTAAGFRAANPKQRQQETRKTDHAIAATIAPTVTPAGLVVHAANLLQRAATTPDALAEMTPRERKVADLALDAIQAHAESIRAAVQDRAGV